MESREYCENLSPIRAFPLTRCFEPALRKKVLPESDFTRIFLGFISSTTTKHQACQIPPKIDGHTGDRDAAPLNNFDYLAAGQFEVLNLAIFTCRG